MPHAHDKRNAMKSNKTRAAVAAVLVMLVIPGITLAVYFLVARQGPSAGGASAYSNVASASAGAFAPGLVAAYSFNEGAGTLFFLTGARVFGIQAVENRRHCLE
jgi:hypothetical protein